MDRVILAVIVVDEAIGWREVPALNEVRGGSYLNQFAPTALRFSGLYMYRPLLCANVLDVPRVSSDMRDSAIA
jgi:hypothetical protein